MRMIALAVIVAAGMAVLAGAQGTPEQALAPGNYGMTLTLEVAPPGEVVDREEVTLKAELTVKGEAISIKAADEDGETHTFTGTMSKGKMNFEAKDDEGTMKCDGEVKSTKEAAGTFVFTIDETKTKGSGKWTMKAEVKKEPK